MGESVNDVTISAFEDELEKIGASFPFLGRIARGIAADASGLGQLGSRLKNPVQGLKAGWEAMSPTRALAAGGKAVPGLGEAIAKQGPQAGFLRKTFGAGEHLLPSHVPDTSTLRGAAETASRAGWTGQGKLTKYLPVGEKGMTVLPAAAAVPGVVRAAAPGGDDSHLGEQVGNVAGGLGAGIMTAGLGIGPTLLAGLGGSLLAAHAGHKYDEARARSRLARLREMRGETPDGLGPSDLASGQPLV